MTREYYIGLMSGTSLDGIDAGLYDFSGEQAQLVDFYYQAYSSDLRQKILQLCQPQAAISLADYGTLDTQLGQLYAEAVLQLLAQAKIPAAQIKAIGNHGQTVHHAPNAAYPFSLQIGDANIISQRTGITTVADFRRRDIAAGGQGAPLVPAFHQAMFHSDTENRVIVNIGGIANLSILPRDKTHTISGFDTGPGNTLMDYWIQQHQGLSYDKNGAWASTGTLQIDLLAELKADAYFSALAPKSTGTEYFSADWLKQKLATLAIYKAEDVQRTLCQLTAETTADAIIKSATETDKVFICGGGIY
ncbi:MAG: anhydro-N-acetylmuramic acid kinase, partial [Methyloprofundus sp.]|nr:anhydro-N-acetylmuramic acid kinase [Methyloprofundus sp.]